MPPQKYHITLDFDSTITTHDTLSPLSKAAISLHPLSLQPTIRSAWDECVSRYIEEYKTFTAAYPVSKDDRMTLEEEIEFLRGARRVEEASFERVGESGLFKFGDGDGSLRREGRKAVEDGSVVMRRGFGEFIEGVLGKGRWWDVVSVNFSGEWVRGCLEGERVELNGIEVLANEIDADGRIGVRKREGLDMRRILDCRDKLIAFRALKRSHDDGQVVRIYIGDSLTDVECLTEADIGICMCNEGESALRETFTRVGREVSHISEFGKSDGTSIYWANDFSEIIKSRLVDA